MKKLEIIYLRKAQEDIDDITYYIAQDNLEAAVAFFEAVESTCAMLSTMPGIGSARDYRNPHTREIRVVGSEHAKIYSGAFDAKS